MPVSAGPLCCHALDTGDLPASLLSPPPAGVSDRLGPLLGLLASRRPAVKAMRPSSQLRCLSPTLGSNRGRIGQPKGRGLHAVTPRAIWAPPAWPTLRDGGTGRQSP